MTLHLSLKPDGPDFIDLPWQLPLSEWREACSRWVELPMGIARHPIVFVQYGEELYAIKQNVAAACRKEYENLRELQRLNLPAVVPIGHGSLNEGDTQAVVITQFLSHSLPYRNLFTQPNLAYYRQFLLDAMAGLLVQLHLNGVFWGDCSLSNTLFRRDAGRRIEDRVKQPALVILRTDRRQVRPG